MSSGLKQFLFTLGAVLIVLLGYEYHARSERVAARAQEEALRAQAEALARQTKQQTEALAEQTKAQTAALQKQADALQAKADALNAEATAMKNEVAAEHQAASDERARYQLRAYRMEGLTAAQSVKVAVAEYYQTTGKLPRSNKEAGVAEPEQFNGQALQRLEVDGNGAITITYNEKSGARNGTIQLLPDTANMTMGLRWRCVSADFADIAQSVAQCEYRPRIAQ